MTDEKGFADFVCASSPRLLHAGELLTGNRDRAEDLLQHALARAYVKWPSIADGQPEAYVRKAMLNAYLDWWRQRRWREAPLDASRQPEPGLADHAVDVVRRDAVHRALAGLTRRERAVVVLRFWLDLSEAQIAAELGVAPGTVKSTASRALARLRESSDLTSDR